MEIKYRQTGEIEATLHNVERVSINDCTARTDGGEPFIAFDFRAGNQDINTYVDPIKAEAMAYQILDIVKAYKERAA